MDGGQTQSIKQAYIKFAQDGMRLCDPNDDGLVFRLEFSVANSQNLRFFRHLRAALATRPLDRGAEAIGDSKRTGWRVHAAQPSFSGLLLKKNAVFREKYNDLKANKLIYTLNLSGLTGLQLVYPFTLDFLKGLIHIV